MLWQDERFMHHLTSFLHPSFPRTSCRIRP